MLISNEFEVAAPAEKVWRFLENVPQVAACLPGAELTGDLGGDTYTGTVAVRMGPVRLQFAGTAGITERDAAANRVVVHASGADQKGRGQASMVITATLAQTGRGTTKVAVVQDLQLSGAAARYGRGMISDVTAVLMRDFAANMQGRIERLDPGQSAEPAAAAAAAPASGFSLGMRAALIALGRVLLLQPGGSARSGSTRGSGSRCSSAQNTAAAAISGGGSCSYPHPATSAWSACTESPSRPRRASPGGKSRMPAVNGVGEPCAGMANKAPGARLDSEDSACGPRRWPLIDQAAIEPSTRPANPARIARRQRSRIPSRRPPIRAKITAVTRLNSPPSTGTPSKKPGPLSRTAPHPGPP